MGVQLSTESGPRTLKLNRKAAAQWSAPVESEMKSDSSLNSEDDLDTRTYHSSKSSPYNIPADIGEGQRLNLQHHLVRHLFEGPNHSGVPLSVLEQRPLVLDVGFGSGIWLAEMNRDFPNGMYFGVDLTISAFAKTFQSLADEGKITLIEGNVCEKLPFKDNTFDYVHQQFLIAGIKAEQWPHAIAELCRVLKPGGYLDIVEFDGVPQLQGKKPDPIAAEFNKKFHQMFLTRGVDIRFGRNVESLVRSFPVLEQVVADRRTGPVGWDGMSGQLWLVDTKKMLTGTADFISTALGMSKEAWFEHVELILKGWTNSKAFIDVYRVIARKRQSSATV
ncbi:S-adenosyl-L-methionine-dependent methyltransferase [Cladochytrium replicatum]|nr:S-adenosyl-L-methionine-dependent methyltransferase [Cladochytrium replicatum]